MNKSRFREEISNYSDFKIYRRIKEYLKEEQAGYYHNSKKLDLLYDESMNRDPDIYNTAMKDSITEFNSSVYQTIEPNVSRPERIREDDNIKIHESNMIFDDSEFDKNDLFLCTVDGVSMKDANISDGDTLIVARTDKIESGDIIIAAIKNKMFVKRYSKNDSGKWLISENRTIDDVRIKEDMDFELFGKVIAAIKKF